MKGVNYIEEIKKSLIKDLDNSPDRVIAKTNFQEQIDNLVFRVRDIHHLSFENTFHSIENHFYDCGYVFYEEPFSSSELIQKINSNLGEIYEASDLMVDIYEKPKNLNYPVKQLNNLHEAFYKVTPIETHKIDLETGDRTPIHQPPLQLPYLLKNLRALSGILEAFYKDRVRMEALEEILDYTPDSENKSKHLLTEEPELSNETKERIEVDLRGNPNMKAQAKGYDFWLDVADEANRLLKKDPDKYQPRSDKHFMSTNLKMELALQFNVGETTVSDNLKKYFKKNNRLFIPNNGY